MRQISGVNICKEVTCMTNYREILRLHSLGLNKTEIASSCLTCAVKVSVGGRRIHILKYCDYHTVLPKK